MHGPINIRFTSGWLTLNIKVCLLFGHWQYHHRMAAITVIARHAPVIITVWTSFGRKLPVDHVAAICILSGCLNETVHWCWQKCSVRLADPVHLCAYVVAVTLKFCWKIDAFTFRKVARFLTICFSASFQDPVVFLSPHKLVRLLWPRCTNLGRLVSRSTKFWKVAQNVFLE